MNWKASVYHQAQKRACKSQNWLRVRRKVLKRDKYQCKMCKVFFGESDLILNAHHIISRKDGGTQKMRNLITLCTKCHDIAEINNLSKKDILRYKANSPLLERVDAPNKDWHKWVYGGFVQPTR